MRYTTLWQGSEAGSITVVGEGAPFTVTAMPVLATYSFGVTVGFAYCGPDSFGHWMSSNSTDAISGWRVAQILPRVRTLRSREYGYDATLTGLVISMTGDRNEERLRGLATDVGMAVGEFVAELERLGHLWPSAEALVFMWDRLPEGEQNMLVSSVREAIATGDIATVPDLESRLRAAEARIRRAHEQMEHEEQLIADGLAPYVSLRQLLEDIGVKNLVFTAGIGEMFDPSHFAWEDLDREVMRELIGERGFSSRVSLVTSALQPDDPNAHHSAGGGGVTLYMSSFGESRHPRVRLGGRQLELVYAKWNGEQEQFALTLRPVGLGGRNENQDVQMTVTELRSRIGNDTGLGRPLRVGEAPAWAAQPSVRSGGIRRLLGRR